MLTRFRRLLLSVKARWLFHQKVSVFGNFTVLQPKKVHFGRGCAINHGVFIHGESGIEIGDSVVLSARCMLIDATLDPATFGTIESRAYENKPITIRDGAWIGAGAIILPGVEIGERSIVGAGSVVTRDVPSGWLVAGNPARLIKEVGK